jgi:serine/threonine protein kinase
VVPLLREAKKAVRGLFSQMRGPVLHPRRSSMILLEKPKLNSKYTSLDELEILQTIGIGGFGRVKLVKHKATGTHLALKQHKKSEILRLHQAIHVNAERSILAELNHPYIIRLCAPTPPIPSPMSSATCSIAMYVVKHTSPIRRRTLREINQSTLDCPTSRCRCDAP